MSNYSSLAARLRSPTATVENARARSTVSLAGLSFDGTEAATRIRELGLRGLPQYPDHTVVPAVVVPSPPQLDSLLDDASRVRVLAAGYRGAVLACYQTRSWFMLRGRLRSHASFSQLLKFGDTLISLEIAPISWCLFAADAWRFMQGPAARPPTARWVFSQNLLTRQRQWFDRERWRWGGRREFPVSEHTALVAAWREMWRDLMCKRPATRRSLLEIVDDHFPGETFETALASARSAARRKQLEIDRQIEAGTNLWK